MTRKVEAVTRSAKTSAEKSKENQQTLRILEETSAKTSAKTEVFCAKCEEPIPARRLKLVRTNICVDCLSDLEVAGRGTHRHQMVLDQVVSRDGEVEEMSFRLIRKQT